ncbi:ADP-dependent NAD(P)H-hydrate dehydratase [Tessaracoccus sp. Z1128]
MTDARDRPTVITPAVLRDWPLPSPRGSKDARGRALIVGGSVPNPGGVLLAARAAMRSGAGKTQLVVPEPVAVPMAVAMPESLVRGAQCSAEGDLTWAAATVVVDYSPGADATLIGPGMLDVGRAVALMEAVAPLLRGTVVLDALALAWLTEDPSRGGALDALVLSPNLSELALTLGVDEEEVRRDQGAAVLRLAEATGAVVSSGSSSTFIGTPDGRLWRSDEGNAGLGVAGSGDVKAGIVVGLCARGAEPAQAAVWAAYLHGTVGGRLASRFGPTGYLAGELPSEIPLALLEIG